MMASDIFVKARKAALLFGAFLFLFSGVAPAAEAELRQADVFVPGENGYHTYRIPAIVVATNGAVLAFCEGRKKGPSDSGDIDLLVKRSLDGGATWEPVQLIRDDRLNVCGNPAPVVDEITGEVLLLTTWNLGSDTEKMIMNGTSADMRRVFAQSSKDNGATWSRPREITADVRKPHWRWYATGPCNGIQLRSGANRGRLLIPANHSDHSDPNAHPFRSHVIYSDDHGATWKLGGIQEPKTNESTLAELANGEVIQNMRSYHGLSARAIATSRDGGLTWSSVMLDTQLIEPVCQASLLRLRDGRIIFSNPASTKRENLSLRISNDSALAFSTPRTVHAGPSAYSCLAQLPDNTILCLYERGEKSPYEKITLARFSTDWLFRK